MSAWAILVGMTVLAQAPPSVLVLPLEPGRGVSREDADILILLVADRLRSATAMRVVTTAEVQAAMQQEQVRQAADCATAGCAAEIAGALAVDEVVIGRAGRLGSRYVISLSRLSASGQPLGSSTRQAEGERVEILADALPAMIAELLGQPLTTAPLPPAAATPILPAAPAPDASHHRSRGEAPPSPAVGSAVPPLRQDLLLNLVTAGSVATGVVTAVMALGGILAWSPAIAVTAVLLGPYGTGACAPTVGVAAAALAVAVALGGADLVMPRRPHPLALLAGSGVGAAVALTGGLAAAGTSIGVAVLFRMVLGYPDPRVSKEPWVQAPVVTSVVLASWLAAAVLAGGAYAVVRFLEDRWLWPLIRSNAAEDGEAPTHASSRPRAASRPR